jgi:hypothetical protein
MDLLCRNSKERESDHIIRILCLFRTLIYCVWNLMAGDEDEERRGSEGIVLPSPIQRRDYRLRMF